MLIAPSVLTADFTKLREELESIAAADFMHIDVMDGHFVPNISFGPAITKSISQATKVPLDIHLMVSNPVLWIEEFSKSNPTYITIHYEAQNVMETIKKIKEYNIKVGISIKPATKVSEIVHILDLVDLVLVMSVEPGFGGQKFMPSAVDKIKELSDIRSYGKHRYLIEVDGGINSDTAKLVKKAGCDIAVAGSYIFNALDRNKLIRELK